MKKTKISSTPSLYSERAIFFYYTIRIFPSQSINMIWNSLDTVFSSLTMNPKPHLTQ